MDTASSSNSEKKVSGGKKRSFTGWLKLLVTVVTVCLAVFQLYTAFFGLFPAMQQRSLHMAFILPLIFLIYPMWKSSPRGRPSATDWIFALAAAACTLYVFFMYEDIARRAGMFRQYELYLGAALIVLVFEAARRVLGYPLPVFCSLFLFFAYYGRSMPGPFRHFGLSIPRIIEELYLTTDGLFGLVTGVSATYIYLFILFGAFLGSTGTSQFFNDLAMALTGHLKGGPAKIAVVSSAFMGTISGSTSANVATTGAFTIPLMKKIGYQAHFAGAVEAAASTGGQIMPPVLGAAAFIIADTLGISYLKVLSAAVVPALLYFWGIWCCLSLEAAKLGLRGLPKSTLPKVKDVLFRSGYKAIPLFGIIYFLVQGYNPLYAGCWGIGLSVVLSFVKKEDRLDLKSFIATLEDGSKSALSVAVACIIVGVVIGMMGATGIALKVGDVILSFTKGNLLLTLVSTMILSMILGMGMPTTASYVMASAVAAPALVLLGCNALDVHFFVFFYAVLSSVTPPVCVGAYTAAGIAGSDPNKTAFTSIKLALAGFIVPFVFVYSPDIMLTNVSSWPTTIMAIMTACIGVYGLAVATEGYIFRTVPLWARLLALAGAISLIIPGFLGDMAGVALLGFVVFYNYKLQKDPASSAP
jgi:TRAP transporter 4TM/12TM fusion protein